MPHCRSQRALCFVVLSIEHLLLAVRKRHEKPRAGFCEKKQRNIPCGPKVIVLEIVGTESYSFRGSKWPWICQVYEVNAMELNVFLRFLVGLL